MSRSSWTTCTSYFERRRFMRFKTVLDEMRQHDVVGSLRQLGDDAEQGKRPVDRPVRILVRHARPLGRRPGRSGRQRHVQRQVEEQPAAGPGARGASDPGRRGEPARRHARRRAGPAGARGRRITSSRPISSPARRRGSTTASTSSATAIRELPDGESEFGYEIGLLGKVSSVMERRPTILAQPETGSPAIGAETEAIELLLQSKRINPKGGGGGGSTPGGGGHGKTLDSALALFGGGVNEKEVREDRGVSQATGELGPSLPEEFRAGLDEYFNRLERNSGGR